MSIVTLEVQVPGEERISQIRAFHESAIKNMSESVNAIARAGILLAEERDTRRGAFQAWVEEFLPFSRKTAYQYIKIGTAVRDGILNLEDVSSMRQALRRLPGEERVSTRPRDKRVESIPALCIKIEQAFNEAIAESPLHSWEADQRAGLLRALDNLDKIRQELEAC